MNRLRYSMSVAALSCFALSPTASSQQDCELDDTGQRYLQLAEDRSYEGEFAIAMMYLERAIEICPTYAAYERLGELAAQSPAEGDAARAANAFAGAAAHAPDDAAWGEALYHAASVYRREGDYPMAGYLIEEARTLKPGDDQITMLAAEIEIASQNPNLDEVMRSSCRRDMPSSKKFRVKNKKGPSCGGFGSLGPSINNRIDFEPGSAAIDADSQPGVERLVDTLKNKHCGKRVVFIGLGDEDGGMGGDPELSRERAQKIYDEVVREEPMLAERIAVKGASDCSGLSGDYMPIDPETRGELLVFRE